MYKWSLRPDLIDVYKMFPGCWINGAPCIDSKGSVTALGGMKTSSSSLFQEGYSLRISIFLILSDVILNLDDYSCLYHMSL